MYRPVIKRSEGQDNIARDLSEHLLNYPNDGARIPRMRREKEVGQNKLFTKNVLREMVSMRNPIKAFKRDFKKIEKKRD